MENAKILMSATKIPAMISQASDLHPLKRIANFKTLIIIVIILTYF